jgi:hypothetical protein
MFLVAWWKLVLIVLYLLAGFGLVIACDVVHVNCALLWRGSIKLFVSIFLKCESVVICRSDVIFFLEGVLEHSHFLSFSLGAPWIGYRVADSIFDGT